MLLSRQPKQTGLGGLLVLFVMLGLLLVACGDSATNSPAAPASTSTTAAMTSAAAVATTASATTSAATTAAMTSAAATTASATTAAAGAAPTGGEIKIGLVSPFSGPLGYLGQYLANSTQIQIDKYNAAGGLLNKKLVLVTRDDGGATDKSVSAVQDLINNEKISMLIGPTFTANAQAVKQFINDAKLIQTLPTVSGLDALKDAPYSYRTQQPDPLQASELAKYIAKDGRKKVALIALNDATGKGYAQLLIPELKNNNVALAGDAQFFSSDQKDLSAQVLKAKDDGADGIVIGTGNATTAALIPKALDQTGFKVPLYGFGGLEGGTYPKLGGDSAIGTVFVDGYRGYPAKVPTAQQPKAYAEHVQAIIAKYGLDQTGQIKGSPLPADAVMIWAEAVKRANSFDADKVKAELEKTNLTADQTPSGTPLMITATDHETYHAGSLHYYKWVKAEGDTFKFDEVK